MIRRRNSHYANSFMASAEMNINLCTPGGTRSLTGVIGRNVRHPDAKSSNMNNPHKIPLRDFFFGCSSNAMMDSKR